MKVRHIYFFNLLLVVVGFGWLYFGTGANRITNVRPRKSGLLWHKETALSRVARSPFKEKGSLIAIPVASFEQVSIPHPSPLRRESVVKTTGPLFPSQLSNSEAAKPPINFLGSVWKGVEKIEGTISRRASRSTEQNVTLTVIAQQGSHWEGVLVCHSGIMEDGRELRCEDSQLLKGTIKEGFLAYTPYRNLHVLKGTSIALNTNYRAILRGTAVRGSFQSENGSYGSLALTRQADDARRLDLVGSTWQGVQGYDPPALDHGFWVAAELTITEQQSKRFRGVLAYLGIQAPGRGKFLLGITLAIEGKIDGDQLYYWPYEKLRFPPRNAPNTDFSTRATVVSFQMWDSYQKTDGGLGSFSLKRTN